MDFKKLAKDGASLLDVRTTDEFSMGHVDNSVNIPLDELNNRMEEVLKLPEPVLVYCQSGMRASSALSLLKSNGVKEVYNAGGWASLL